MNESQSLLNLLKHFYVLFSHFPKNLSEVEFLKHKMPTPEENNFFKVFVEKQFPNRIVVTVWSKTDHFNPNLFVQLGEKAISKDDEIEHFIQNMCFSTGAEFSYHKRRLGDVTNCCKVNGDAIDHKLVITFEPK